MSTKTTLKRSRKSFSLKSFLCVPNSCTIFLLFAALFISINNCKAQREITNLSTTYSENFNSLGAPSASQPTLPTGFVFGGDWTSSSNQVMNVAGMTGTGTTIGIGSTAGSYNFGDSSVALSTDRAIGFIGGSPYRWPRSILYAFKNKTGDTVKTINVGWNYEKYRLGTAGFGWLFYHGDSLNIRKIVRTSPAILTTASFLTLTAADTAGIVPGMALSMVSGTGAFKPGTVVTTKAGLNVSFTPTAQTAVTAGSTIAFTLLANNRAAAGDTTDANNGAAVGTIVSPPASTNKSFQITSVSIPPDSVYYLRWMYGFGIPYSTSFTQGLAIDDFTISLGNGKCSPSQQAVIDSFTNVSTDSMKLFFTRKNGDSVMVVASTVDTVFSPVNDELYNADSTYGNGSSIGGGFVIYKGKGNGPNAQSSITVKGLKSSTKYYYYVYEFNKSGTGSGLCYKTSAGTGNQQTSSAATDYFRSKQSTAWSDPTTWESSYDSIKWVKSSIKPTSSAKSILIKDSVTITQAESAKMLTVASGAKLTYTTGTGFTGGSAFNVVDDGSEAFDFNIYGTYVVFGAPATLVATPFFSATVKVFNGGLIRADANSGGLSDNFAFNPSVYFTNGSVFEYNTSTALNASGRTYFTYKNAQPKADIPTFRLSKPLSTVGGGSPTTINGILEVNARLEFVLGGIKTFRNGLIGSATLVQSATCGPFVITDTAAGILGGTGIDSLNSNGLKIAAGGITNLISNKTITSGPLIVEGKLNLGNYDITLASNVNNTASAGKMGAAGEINYNGTGRFVVERYINSGTGAGQHGKSWQFLATPTNTDGQTIKSAWQEGAINASQNPTLGYGIQIISNLPDATTILGFDGYTPVGPSMKTYDAISNSWVGVSRTDTTLYNNKGYMVFVRGDRTVTAYTQSPTPTIVRTRGKLLANGNVPASINVTAGSFESVANPYASAINFDTLYSLTSGTLDKKFYLWDPTAAGVGFGGWQTLSAVNGYQTTTHSNYFLSGTSYNKIQSGQAFFVYSTTGGATVNFAENIKASDNRLVNRAVSNGDSISKLSSFIISNIDSLSTRWCDGNVIVFNDNYSNGLDGDDAVKLINPGENFGIKNDNKTLSVEAKQQPIANDTIHYIISGLKPIVYNLLFVPQNITSTGVSAALIDQYLQTRTPVSLTDSTYIPFAINSDNASAASNRFMVVFSPTNPLPVCFLGISAAKNSDKSITINWKTSCETGINHYELEHSADGRQFSLLASVQPVITSNQEKLYSQKDNQPYLGDNFYRVKAVNQNGTYQYSAIVKVSNANEKPFVRMYTNPVLDGNPQILFNNVKSDNYSISLNNMAGQLLFKTNWIVAEGTQIKTLNTGKVLPYGNYQLSITDSNNKTTVLSLLVR
jgi:hypothetical protein